MTNNKFINNICIGIFIHNEERHLELCLQDLSKQSIFNVKDIEVQVYILCNGCSDNSVQVSQKIAEKNGYTVFDWSEGGKSHTWNRFVHETVASDTETIIFVDGDLELPEPQAIENLVSALNSSPSVLVSTSQPIKNVSIYSRWNPLRYIASIINSPHRDGSICGQLYAIKGESARNVWLPNPCLVEDGFLAATIVTNFFQESPEMDFIKAVPEAKHLFEPPSDLIAFFQHDVRLTLGIELNAALYTQLWRTKNLIDIHQLMQEFSTGNIDFAITEHLGMPQNHALQYKHVLRYGWPKGQRPIKGLVLLPVRITHMIYMIFVFKSARSHFKHRQFKW